jgi:hypothetical protein
LTKNRIYITALQILTEQRIFDNTRHLGMLRGSKRQIRVLLLPLDMASPEEQTIHAQQNTGKTTIHSRVLLISYYTNVNKAVKYADH